MDFSRDEQIIADVLKDARHIQEFIWGDLSLSLKPFDPEAWRKVFQKRVDRIAALNADEPTAVVLLRKALLQQAALSIAALAVIAKDEGKKKEKAYGG